jgi:protocatechuate 3,4-dioxygenase beta subunit/5-hydroxyisourate hydrolase-like protein (transthyretin family)
MNHAHSLFGAALLLLTCVVTSAQDGPAEGKKPASLAGMATNSLTGEPLPHVEVELQRKISGHISSYRRAVTGRDGRFLLTGIEAGSYIVDADRNGYHRADDPTLDEPPMLAVKPGEEIKDILLRFEPDALIAGRVVGPDGAPMEGVEVQAIGHRLSMRNDTDDRGEFVIGGLSPGRYLVRAALKRGRHPEVRKDGSVAANYGVAYFPNARTSVGAVPVVARASQETAIEIKMLPEPELHISGNISGDFLDQGVFLELENWWDDPSHATLDQGRFNFARVLPGRYRLYAENRSARSAAMIIDVTDASVDGIQLRLSPPVELTAQIRDEDWKQIKALAREDFGAVEITLKPFGLFMPEGSYTCTVSADGSCKVKDVAPGRYYVRMSRAPETYYVRSLQIGEREFHDGILEIGGGPAQQQLLIELGADGAEVSGIVRGEKGGVGGAAVLLLAQDGSFSAFVHGDRTSEDGSYRFQGITPGKYKLLALNKKHSASLVLSDEALELDRNVIEEIEVRAGDRITQDLKMGAQ